MIMLYCRSVRLQINDTGVEIPNTLCRFTEKVADIGIDSGGWNIPGNIIAGNHIMIIPIAHPPITASVIGLI